MTPSERDIERAILTWLSYQPECKVWKNKSTGTYDPVRKAFRRSNDKFSQKGTSDILGIWQGRMLCIEVKSAKGKLSPEQRQFLHEMSSLGAFCMVARSLQDVVDALASSMSIENSGQSDFC